MRVTDEETMEVVEWVLAGQVQQDIVGLINAAGGKAVGLTGRDGGLIRARKLKMVDKDDPSKEHDVGQVGEIDGIDPSVVQALQDDQFIPVISPIGFGEHNESYNINADVVAGKLAEVLKAEKLVLLTNTPGVLDKDGKLLTDLSAREIDELFADGTISRRHAAQDRRRARCRQERRQRGAHHRRPRAARDAAGDPDRAGLRHDDPLALSGARAPPSMHAGERPSQSAAARQRVWLFDLDNTLHDARTPSFGRLNAAMTDYIARELDLDADEADALRLHYWRRYGATLLGLVRHHGVQRGALPAPHPRAARRWRPAARPSRATSRRCARLPGRKFVLTNAPRAYALRVLRALGMERCSRQ